ncbi:Ankyrin-3 [Colletotrichum sp. SAR 10_96]|nr:Ankyrin-3 [Colletotrichum sp. SAR 10_96]
MTEIIANMNISAPAESFAENKADVNPEAAKPPVNNGSHRASVLHKFFEDLEDSAEGTQEVGTFRNSIRSMVDDDGIEEGLDMKDLRGRTLLHIAASEGLAETAKRLIDAGLSLDARDEWGDTPLIDACRAGNNIEVVRLLLGRGAKPDIFSNEGDSPLFKAARNGHSATVQYLLNQVKWDLDIGEKEYDMTPLHAAALSDDRETLRYLRDNGAKLDLLDTDGWTPLMTAINSRNKNSMEELLQKRNDEDLQLGRKDLQERTPILRAAEMGFWDGFRLLRKAGAKWTETESKTTEAADGDSASDMSKKDAALHLAISGNQIDIVEFLLEQGANVNSRGQDGQQPLHLASLRGNTDIMELVLNSKKFNHLDIGDDDRMTPLHLACTADEYDGHYNEAVQLLLGREPKPNMEMKTIDGKTALELAFDSGHDERGLLVLGVFAQESSRISDTLMWAAGKTERHKIAAYLLKEQVKVSPDSSHWTAIEWAAYAREPQALWLLIASSPRSKGTKDVLKSAKALVEKSKKQGKGSVSNPEIQETSQTGVTKKGSKDIKWQEIEDILNNPPIGVMCRDNSTYSLLRCEDKHSSDTYNATIVQFYKTQGQFESIMGSQSIRETIYGRGPADVMDEVVNKLKKLADSHLKGLKESAHVQQPIFMNSEPKFTWIHLPATNIVWMNVGLL